MIIISGLILIYLLPSESVGQILADYLITSDINGFIASKNPTAGDGPGMLAGVDHFYFDHKDRTFRISYFNLTTRVGPVIQVTQHAGSDSDKWLLHEIDMDFRTYYGLPGRSYGPRQIEGQTVLEDVAGGRNYRWLSGNKVIMIEYRDPQLTKHEPIEVVGAYLAKHPSTLPPIRLIDLRSAEYKAVWIKDEMERRLWLCDKWFVQLESDRSKLSSILKTIADHMVVFLDYREKYYGIQGKDDKIALTGYLSAKDETSIRNKLAGYKTWWNANKTKSIHGFPRPGEHQYLSTKKL